jgi:hypothetical protein
MPLNVHEQKVLVGVLASPTTGKKEMVSVPAGVFLGV